MMIALASSQGARAGRIAALGLMSGVLVHTLVATTGGSLVLQQLAECFVSDSRARQPLP
jgi:threonine/homoserine/homoserine lactone efflux protein